MKDRLVSFTVDYPQLEQSPQECNMGRKKARVYKNQASPALMLGSLNLISPTSSPLRSQASPFHRSNSPSASISHPNAFSPSSNSPKNVHLLNLLNQFPKYTKAHPKYTPTNPIVESIHPNKRICDFATNSILNRSKII
jgi:hypothetical protein